MAIRSDPVGSDTATRAFNGTTVDRRIWAAIAWRVGVEEFHFALADKLKENDVDKAVLRTPAAAFQSLLRYSIAL